MFLYKLICYCKFVVQYINIIFRRHGCRQKLVLRKPHKHLCRSTQKRVLWITVCRRGADVNTVHISIAYHATLCIKQADWLIQLLSEGGLQKKYVHTRIKCSYANVSSFSYVQPRDVPAVSQVLALPTDCTFSFRSAPCYSGCLPILSQPPLTFTHSQASWGFKQSVAGFSSYLANLFYGESLLFTTHHASSRAQCSASTSSLFT